MEEWQSLLDSAYVNVEKERTVKVAAEELVKIRAEEIDRLQVQLDESGKLAKKEQEGHQTSEDKLKVAERQFQEALVKAVEERKEVVSAAEVKGREEGVEAFKDSQAGIQWCQNLIKDALAESLRKTIAFVKGREANFDWSGCPYYEKLGLEEEGDDEEGEEEEEGDEAALEGGKDEREVPGGVPTDQVEASPAVTTEVSLEVVPPEEQALGDEDLNLLFSCVSFHHFFLVFVEFLDIWEAALKYISPVD